MAMFQSRRVLSWVLVGLPVGLLLSVILFALAMLTQEGNGGGVPVQVRKEALSPGSGMNGESKLREYVAILSERVGERNAGRPEGLRAAELFLESTFGKGNLGYEVHRREFEVRGQKFANLEMILPGKDRAAETLVVGAHYDTASGSPGADDNASGIAALLVIAERFVGNRQSRTLRWVAFCNEEPPWFQTPDMGSMRYADCLKREGVNVVAMLSLESLGYFRDEPGSQKYPEPLASLYPDKGNFLGVVGNLESRKLVDFVFERLRRAGTIPVEKGVFPESVPGVGWSDQWGFWKQGVSALMLTDTAPYRNPHYHRPSDKLETLDFSRLASATEAIRGLIEILSNDPGTEWK